MKVKLDEKERKSQIVTVGFGLLLTTKPYILKLDVEGTATLMGKDADIKKMLETDSETKVPPLLQKVYQHVFTALYLLSTVLDAPAPPPDLFGPQKPDHSVEGVNVEVAAETAKPADGVTIQADTANLAKTETAST